MTRTFLAFLLLAAGLTASSPRLLAQGTGLKKPSFDSAGVPIHYVVTGKQDGEPVVLIHGFTASIDRQWSAVIAGLSKEYKIIAMDCRGHGGSGKPHDAKKYGTEMVKDVLRLLDHLKIRKAHIVGYSMGSAIAMNFTIRHPDRVISLTLGGAGAPLPGTEKLLIELADSLEKGQGFGPLIIALNPKGQPLPTPEQIKAIDARIMKSNDVKALTALIRGMVGSKTMQLSPKQIQDVRVPVLCIVGSGDPLRAGVNLLKVLLPKTRVIVITKADHITAFTRPEFVEALHQFLIENRQPKTKSLTP